MLISVRDMARIVRVDWSTLIIWGWRWGMQVNDTHIIMIFLERGMFSALFITKTIVVRLIVWLLRNTGNEIVRMRRKSLQRNEFDDQAECLH